MNSRHLKASGQRWPLYAVVLCLSAIFSCSQVALYERTRNIPKGEWSSKEVLSFPFDIADTARSYNVLVTLRHTNLYPYRNIWVEVGLRSPGDDSSRVQLFELPLASAEGWLGSGMGDVYERRVRLFQQPVKFHQPGQAVFTLRHTMRQDPLPAVLQAGIRVEPVP